MCDMQLTTDPMILGLEPTHRVLLLRWIMDVTMVGVEPCFRSPALLGPWEHKPLPSPARTPLCASPAYSNLA